MIRVKFFKKIFDHEYKELERFKKIADKVDALEKEKSLTAPILFHLFLNLTSILLIPLVVRYQTIVLDLLFIVSLVCFVILYHSQKWKAKEK